MGTKNNPGEVDEAASFILKVGAYMAKRCMCGHVRADHAHGRRPVLNQKTGEVVSVGGRLLVTCVLCHCEHFADEFERQLVGDPREVFEGAIPDEAFEKKESD